MDDVSSFSHRKLSTILKDPSHPHHAAAKAEIDRRNQTESTVNEVSQKKLSDYMRASSADVPKARGNARRQDKRIGGQKMADEKIRKKQGYGSSAKVAAESTQIDEISVGKLSSYAKAASKDIDQKRNKVKAALDQPASVKHAKAGMKAMSGLTKRSRGSDMYVNKMTGRSKVKPTAEATMKTFFQLREELSSQQVVSEEITHGFGYDKKSHNAAQKGLKSAHAAGMKINHGDQGNTPGSKPHKKPDVTVHYEIGDKPHRDGASGVTLHTAAAKKHPSAEHFKKAGGDDDHGPKNPGAKTSKPAKGPWLWPKGVSTKRKKQHVYGS